MIAVDARCTLLAAAVLRAWRADARAASNEARMCQALEEAEARSTAALRVARAEARQLRQQRLARALAGAAAERRAQLASALLSWLKEARNLQAARQLSTALEDAEFRSQRALSLHRAQAKASRESARRAGLAGVQTRRVAAMRAALTAWRCSGLADRGLRESEEHRLRDLAALRRCCCRCISRSIAAEGALECALAFCSWRLAMVQARAMQVAASAEPDASVAPEGPANMGPAELAAAAFATASQELEAEIGKARRSGSRAGQAAARRAWAGWAGRGGDIAVLLMAFGSWVKAMATRRHKKEISRQAKLSAEAQQAAEQKHAAALTQAWQAAAASTMAQAEATPGGSAELLETERMRTRAAGEVAQQALLLSWPTVRCHVGVLAHWKAAAFEAWWWAVVRPRCDLESLPRPGEVPAPARIEHPAAAPAPQQSSARPPGAPARRPGSSRGAPGATTDVRAPPAAPPSAMDSARRRQGSRRPVAR